MTGEYKPDFTENIELSPLPDEVISPQPPEERSANIPDFNLHLRPITIGGMQLPKFDSSGNSHDGNHWTTYI